MRFYIQETFTANDGSLVTETWGPGHLTEPAARSWFGKNCGPFDPREIEVVELAVKPAEPLVVAGD